MTTSYTVRPATDTVWVLYEIVDINGATLVDVNQIPLLGISPPPTDFWTTPYIIRSTP